MLRTLTLKIGHASCANCSSTDWLALVNMQVDANMRQKSCWFFPWVIGGCGAGRCLDAPMPPWSCLMFATCYNHRCRPCGDRLLANPARAPASIRRPCEAL